MAVSSFMVPLGAPAPEFDLPSVDGGRLSLAEIKPAQATLVMFLCNHCPYVRRIEDGIGRLAADYRERVETVAICSNDVAGYPDDDPRHLAAQARRAGFGFPYLIDESQEVAKAYHAACTPDFFLYDAGRRLAYRGEFDDARPSNQAPVTGAALRRAIDAVLAGEQVPVPQHPSLGCGIKWKPGNEP
ncbi:thioredoxin family protein [Sphaerisporangium melleum]|uniref:Thioredoxin family protein n=1 Tax=Sphaerisporangium melleum TaxID=321316 RepID=A0A917RR26_9ACTN|nr:thioredoxin family protein [Sphaerisporangium melleum]GGL20120.1 thioredoxin family protein [Sphaerisporangium melleum]GII71310.1 thioredoxin family protein [Sphaerisporangium melleum]